MSSESTKKKVAIETVVIDFTDAGVAYAPIGVPTTRPAASILISSDVNAAVVVSFDGVNDVLMVSAGNKIETLNFNANSQNDGRLELASGTQVYARRRSSAVTNGALYLSFIGAV